MVLEVGGLKVSAAAFTGLSGLIARWAGSYITN
jgi:hypothetical protein